MHLRNKKLKPSSPPKKTRKIKPTSQNLVLPSTSEAASNETSTINNETQDLNASNHSVSDTSLESDASLESDKSIESDTSLESDTTLESNTQKAKNSNIYYKNLMNIMLKFQTILRRYIYV